MAKDIEFHKWKVPELSADDMAGLTRRLKTAPPPGRNKAIYAVASTAFLVVAASAISIAHYFSGGLRSDISDAKELIQSEFKISAELNRWRDDETTEYDLTVENDRTGGRI